MKNILPVLGTGGMFIDKMKERSVFKSRFGAIATTAGSAIGLGNIWRFPYEMGNNGGGSYLLVYLLSIFLVGIPVLIAEFTIGSSTHLTARKALIKLAPGTSMHHFSLLGYLGALLTLAFYSVVAGWILGYLIQAFSGQLIGYTAPEYALQFNQFVSNPWMVVATTALMLIINHVVIRSGVQKGVERVNRVLMPLLFVMLVVFAIRSLFLPAAREGLTFMFKPSFKGFQPRIMLDALGQAFFTLSIGEFVAETYASYFTRGTKLMKTAVMVAVADTTVALLAGIFLFPAIFSYGCEVAAGPKFIFEVIPTIFSSMPGGEFWAVVFFCLLLFAALTSTISMSEMLVASVQDQITISRHKATGVVTGVAMVLALMCALSFNVLGGFQLLGQNLFGMFEYLVSNFLMPLCGLFICYFVGYRVSPSVFEKAVCAPAWAVSLLRICLRYIAPISILMIFLYDLFA